MTLLEIFILGLGLSMDCFAVSLTLGTTCRLQLKDVLRMAFFFGLFQAMMPFAGWLVGNSFKSLIQNIDHWLAFSILAFIGIRMIVESFRIKENKNPADVRKFNVLIGLAVATSIDALATGIGFGFIRVNIFEAITIIGLTTFVVTLIGARIGYRSRVIPAKWAELTGGLVLILIGVKILVEHLGLI